MRVVIDTNVFLIAFSKHHRFTAIYDALYKGEIELAISNEILMEYAEKMEIMFSTVGPKILDGISYLPNVVKVDTKFKFLLIEVDPDDNKFVDCAIAINADYLVSNDKHFNVLKDIPFPSVVVITADQFLQILKES